MTVLPELAGAAARRMEEVLAEPASLAGGAPRSASQADPLMQPGCVIKPRRLVYNSTGRAG